MTRTITGTVKVQIDKYTSLEALKGADEKVFQKFTFGNHDMSEWGYSTVGTATVTVELNDPDTIIGDKVGALRAEAKKVRAEAQKRCTDIEAQVQQLLAITFDAEAA